MREHEDQASSSVPQENIQDSIASAEPRELVDGTNCQSHSMFLRFVAVTVLLFGGTAYGALLWVPELALKLPFIPETKAVSNVSGGMSCGSCSLDTSSCSSCPSEALMSAEVASMGCSSCDASSPDQASCHCEASLTSGESSCQCAAGTDGSVAAAEVPSEATTEVPTGDTAEVPSEATAEVEGSSLTDAIGQEAASITDSQ